MLPSAVARRRSSRDVAARRCPEIRDTRVETTTWWLVLVARLGLLVAVDICHDVEAVVSAVVLAKYALEALIASADQQEHHLFLASPSRRTSLRSSGMNVTRSAH